MKTFILILLALTASLGRAQIMCADVMKATVSVNQFETLTGKSLHLLVNQFKTTIRPEVISGKEAPGKNDFENIKNLLINLKSLKEELKNNQEAAYLLGAVAADVKESLASDIVFQRMTSLHKEVRENRQKTFLPTERELKRSYQFYVLELNKILPRELRIPIVRLYSDNRIATINAEAKKYIKGVEKKYEEIMKEPGIDSYETFVEKLRKSEDPEVKLAIKLIEEDKIQVVIRLPDDVRFWIPKVGFQNQFITKTSSGTLDANLRNSSERNQYAQEDLAAYAARDPEFKPKYGTFSLKPRSSTVTPDLEDTATYGPDIYGFKTAAIQDRLTFYANDSLGPATRITSESKSWDASVIPWKYRMMMVPHMIYGLKSKTFSVGPDTLRLLPERAVMGPHQYWEIQLLGSVRLEDVETFTFTQAENPPRGEFLRKLLKNNIKIYDGSSGLGPTEIKPWTPSPQFE